MRKALSFIALFLTMEAMAIQPIIPTIDVHSHVVTEEYLKYLANNDALMDDGYPLPSWNQQSHLAFMESSGIERSVLTLSSP